MTEDKARTKWCPFAHYVLDSSAQGSGNRFSTNRTGRHDSDVLCVGSDCMAWRISVEPPITEHTHGYCGLAGKPDDTMPSYD